MAEAWATFDLSEWDAFSLSDWDTFLLDPLSSADAWRLGATCLFLPVQQGDVFLGPVAGTSFDPVSAGEITL